MPFLGVEEHEFVDVPSEEESAPAFEAFGGGVLDQREVVRVAAVGSPWQFYFASENQLVVRAIETQIGTCALGARGFSISVRLKASLDASQRWHQPILATRLQK